MIQLLRRSLLVLSFNTTSTVLLTQLSWSKFIINCLEFSLTPLYSYIVGKIV